MYRLLVYRYFIFGIMGLETLITPMLLEREIYGNMEYVRGLVFLCQFAFLGACTGYITIVFKHGMNLTGELKAITLLCCIVIFVASLLFLNDYWVGLGCIAVILSFYIETLAKVEQRYTLSMLYKPLFSTCVVLLALMIWLDALDIDTPSVIVAVCAIMSFFGFLLVSKLSNVGGVNILGVRLSYKGCSLLIKEGILVNASTALIAITLFSDRSWIKYFYPDQLPSYSLAMNLSQFVLLAITMFSFVNQVELGKVYQEEGIDALLCELKNKMIFSGKVYSVLIVLFVPFLYGVSIVMPFQNVFIFALVTGVFYGAAQVLFSVNISLVYVSKYGAVTALLLVSLMVNLMMDYIVISLGLGVVYVLLTSYLCFIFVGILVFCYLVKLQREGRN